jgi:hypothetical protein
MSKTITTISSLGVHPVFTWASRTLPWFEQDRIRSVSRDNVMGFTRHPTQNIWAGDVLRT